jgi:8-oxo-dGTP diphosphatase
MSTQNWEQPTISVDVIPVRFNKATKSIEIVLGRRQFEPHLGDLALPGVLLSPHERVSEAASRALATKAFIPVEAVKLIKDVGIADNPDRDPRGATLSIVNLAILDDAYVLPERDDVETFNLSDVTGLKLPFDHSTLIIKALTQLDASLMNDKEATRSLLGDTFRTTDLHSSFVQLNDITGSTAGTPDLSNLSRTLKSSPWLTTQAGPKPTSGKGRPSSVWAWV